jgi:hypothetical protein
MHGQVDALCTDTPVIEHPLTEFKETWMILYKFDGLWGNTFISDRFLPRQWGKSTQLGHKVGRQP